MGIAVACPISEERASVYGNASVAVSATQNSFLVILERTRLYREISALVADSRTVFIWHLGILENNVPNSNIPLRDQVRLFVSDAAFVSEYRLSSGSR